jgi:hypothetical protein
MKDRRTSDPLALRPYHALALVPAIGMLGGIPFANGVESTVLGLPFLLAWIVGWIVVTSAVLGLLYRVDAAALRGLGHDVVGPPEGTS